MKSLMTLVLGASPNSDRYSFLATNLLYEKGYQIYPFGIKEGYIGKHPILLDWPTTHSIDTVSLYIGPLGQGAYYEKILALNPRRIIFNPGTENPDLQALAIANGIQTLEACTLVLLKSGQY